MPQNAGLRIIQQEERTKNKKREEINPSMTKNIRSEKISPAKHFFEAKSFEAKKKIYTELRMRVHIFFFNKKKI